MDQSFVPNIDSVVNFKAFPQAAKNGNGIIHIRLIHEHSLKTALEGRVLFNMLTVFIQGGGTNAMKFAPGKHRLQHIARINRTLRFTGTHDGMHLVDE